MNLSDGVKGFILAIIVISFFLYGYRYYRYTQDEPEFCESCHLVKESYADWLNSKHRDVLCQKCHQMGNVEQNFRLISYVMTGKDPIAVAHGRTKPWEECAECHRDIISQGAVSPKRAHGHAKHVEGQKIACKECHQSTMHNFPPDDNACVNCHKDKGVHGIELSEFSCQKCHAFSTKPLPAFSKTKCVQCHTGIPRAGPMSGLSCHYCHKPHKVVKQDSRSCSVECHKTESSMGLHGMHVQSGIECMHCHKPHGWSIPEGRLRALCSECHAYSNPRAFRYSK